MLQTSKKPGVNEQRMQAYAEALEQLLDLDRTSAPNDVFAPLQTRGELGWHSSLQRAEGQSGSDERLDKQGECQHTSLLAPVTLIWRSSPLAKIAFCRASAGVPALVGCRRPAARHPWHAVWQHAQISVRCSSHGQGHTWAWADGSGTKWDVV